MKYWQTLIRREFWEHRALWLAPLVVAGLLVVLTFLAGGVHISADARVEIDGQIDFVKAPDRGVRRQAVRRADRRPVRAAADRHADRAGLLHARRAALASARTRSILFWKSLLVSDAHTVATKALVALLVVPLGVWAISVLTSLAIMPVPWASNSGGPFATLVCGTRRCGSACRARCCWAH
ncbi:MAG: hypothetical protein R3E65_10310 [Steroidobacteraceae bacterium]